MIGWKRFVRPDLVFSAIGHVGVLLLGLFVFGAGAERPPLPEAMTVEIVPPSEAPQFDPPQPETPQTETPPHVDGTPLESTSTGSEVSSNSEKGSATAEPPKPKMALPSPELTRQRSNPQRSASLAATQPLTASPEEPQPETQPQATEPLLHPEAARSEPDVGEMFAMPLALPGGRLGGGFDAPSANPAMLPHDDIALFFARASSCTHMPDGTTIDENIRVVLRVSFKRDGTLASQPIILDASFLPGTSELIQAAMSALEKCQPYAELPKDKYNEWKTINMVVTPRILSGG
jgi:hypothetical protein